MTLCFRRAHAWSLTLLGLDVLKGLWVAAGGAAVRLASLYSGLDLLRARIAGVLACEPLRTVGCLYASIVRARDPFRIAAQPLISCATTI